MTKCGFIYPIRLHRSWTLLNSRYKLTFFFSNISWCFRNSLGWFINDFMYMKNYNTVGAYLYTCMRQVREVKNWTIINQPLFVHGRDKAMGRASHVYWTHWGRSVKLSIDQRLENLTAGREAEPDQFVLASVAWISRLWDSRRRLKFTLGLVRITEKRGFRWVE